MTRAAFIAACAALLGVACGSPPPAPREPMTVYRDRGAGRPTKKQRRDIEKLRR